MVGEVLAGTYRLIVAIKKGGMGVVYEAENVRLPNVRYAVKVLRPKWARDVKNFATNYARFEREAEIISGLRHPNIVAVLDFNKTEEGYPFLVMELLEGEDLQKKLKREGKLRPEEVCRLMRQVGSALQLAHDRGVVHRDLKPSNIFLARSVEETVLAKLLDFGISKSLDSPKKVTVERQVVLGTAAYMAPEQARGAVQDIDHLSDIFSLATVAYRCLTGEAPFSGSNDSDIRYAVCFAEPPTLGTVVPGLPPRTGEVLRRAHSKRKEDRYQRAQEFVDELIKSLDETSIDADVLYAEDDVTGPLPSPEPPKSADPPSTTGPHPLTTRRLAAESPDVTGPPVPEPAIPSDPEPTAEVRGRSLVFWASLGTLVAAAVVALAFFGWGPLRRVLSEKPPATSSAKPAVDGSTKPHPASTPVARVADPDDAVEADPPLKAGKAGKAGKKVAKRPVRVRKPLVEPVGVRTKMMEPPPKAKKKKVYYFDDV
jgi:serine/threonine-protein kinase